MKIKTFKQIPLDDEVNEWLSKNEGIKIIDMRLTHSTGWGTVLIFLYE